MDTTAAPTAPTTSAAAAAAKQLYIDASTLEGRYMRCPRAYHYNSLLRRESAEPKAGRSFGRVVHTVLKQHYSGVVVDLNAAWAPESAELDQPNEYRSRSYLDAVWHLYRDSYSVEPFDVVRIDNIPVVEKAFAVPLGTVSTLHGEPLLVIWTGIIDLVTRWPDGTVWVLDHKTSSIAGPTFWAEFENSTAQLGYCWAWKQLFGTAPAGYIINGIFTRKESRTGKGLELVRQKYPLDLVDVDAKLAEFEQNTLHTVAELVDNAEREYWPKHTGSCKTPYGMCEYLPVCRLPTTQREALLNSNLYRNVTWDPLAL